MSINRIIKALGVPKSSVYYKPKAYPDRQSPARKTVDNKVKAAVVEITKAKATYGTPRVRSILKRDYGIQLTKYMTHRILKEEGLLITRNRTRGKSRSHTGKISVEQPNTRWASDITSIKCWNGQKLRFTYILDCCDRSIIAWKAGLQMQACDIELMFQDALFERFGDTLPKPDTLEFLHDNGPEYIENKLQETLSDWNIVDCRTPTYSPQSNGMCEAFNGTFKRDYVYENCLETPQSVTQQIQHWIDEYNSFAPHSALDMKTPNEFYIFKCAA